MTNIEIKPTPNQSVDIIPQETEQNIALKSETEQRIGIAIQTTEQDIKILQNDCGVGISISTCPLKNDFAIAIDSKVPKALSVLPQIEDEEISTPEHRGIMRLYIDADGVPHFATLEQIKKLNTKAICVDGLNDTKIKTLSDEDIILLKER